jgi:hypothetical protein
MAMTRAHWCQMTTGAGWPGEYRECVCRSNSGVEGQTAMGVGWMGTMYTYARQGGLAELTVAWPESNGSVLFTIIVVAEGVITEARDRDTSGGLEFTASLSLRMAGEPGHQQVIGIVLFGEMGG